MNESMVNFLGLKIEKSGDGKIFTYIADIKQALDGYSEFFKSIPCHQDEQITIESESVDITPDSIKINTGSVKAADGKSPFDWEVKGLFNRHLIISAAEIEFKKAGEKCKVTACFSGILDVLNTSGETGIPVQLNYSTKIKDKPFVCWELNLANEATDLSVWDIKNMTRDEDSTPAEEESSLETILKSLIVDKDDFRILTYHPTNYNAYIELGVNCNYVFDLGDLIKIENANIKAFFTSGIFAVLIKGNIKIAKAKAIVELAVSSVSWARLSIKVDKDEDPLSLTNVVEWIKDSVKGLSPDLLSESTNDAGEFLNFSVNGIEASFSLHDKSFNDVNILGTVTLASLKIDTTAHLLSKSISGKLRKEQSVTTVLESLGLPTMSFLQNLKISEIKFDASFESTFYSIFFKSDSNVDISVFHFSGFTFRINYDPVSKGGISFVCNAAIGDLPLMFSGDFSCDSDVTECVLKGGLADGNKMHLSDLVEKIAGAFDVDNPKCVDFMDLDKVTVTYKMKKDEGEILFECGGNVTIGSCKVKTLLTIKVTDKPKKDDAKKRDTTIQLYGSLDISGYVFEFKYINTNNGYLLSANCGNSTKDNVALSELIEGLCGKKLPVNLKIDISLLQFCYYVKHNSDKTKPDSKYVLVGAGVNSSFVVADIPFIGAQFSDFDFKISDLQFLYCHTALESKDIETINKSLADLKGKALKIPKRDLKKGLLLTGNVKIGDFKIDIDSGDNKYGTDPKPKQLLPGDYGDEVVILNADPVVPLFEEESEELPQVTWININKKLGPVFLGRIGFETGESIALALDTSLSMGPVTLSLMELKGSKSDDGFKFGLKGAGLSIDAKRFALSGQLLRENNPEGYYGCAMLVVGDFSIRLLGGYTPSRKKDDKELPASMFIYTNIESLGGPIHFNILGIAGGFGLNYSLNIPPIEKLHNFILLPTPGSKAPSVKGMQPREIFDKVVPQMKEVITPVDGQYWISAGLHVRSFQMVDIFALATVSFGVDLVISLIGTASMTLPKGAQKPIAYVEIVIKAAYTMSEGLLSIEGAIAPATYLLGDFCKLKGGIAFYLWINPPEKAGVKQGDFCLSIGGYHPDYIKYNLKPKHYPTPAPIELKFNLGSLQVQGSGYFAVVPSMFMFGLMVRATYQIPNIKVWFQFTLDMFLSWSPLKYDAKSHIEIGVTAQVGIFKISGSVSADLEIWGPEFGGKALVNLSIIKFTITFGEKRKANPELLTWNQFSDSFLFNTGLRSTNATQNPFSLSLPEGQIEAVDESHWIIDANNFNIVITSLIPANVLNKPDSNEHYKSRQSINVKMLGKNDVQSTITVKLEGSSKESHLMVDIQAKEGEATGALWQKHNENVSLNDPAFLEKSICGVIIKPRKSAPGHVDNVPVYSLLFNKGHISAYRFQKQSLNPDYKVEYNIQDDTLRIKVSGESELTNHDYNLNAIAADQVSKRRNRILNNLNEIGLDLYSGEQCTLKKFAEETILADWPLVGLTGDNY